MRNPFGLPSIREREYAQPERLADVMALIQVLAFDEHSHRSEEGLQSEIKGTPLSSSSWKEVAQAHPEFFRVTGKPSMSLVARHVMPDRTLSTLPSLASIPVGGTLSLS